MFLLDYKFQIMNYCIRDLNKGYYASKIAKELKLNQKSVSNYLNELETTKILISILEGRNKVFYFNFKEKIFLSDFLTIINIIKKINFLKRNRKIYEIVEKLNIENYLIFGSYAKGLEKPKSDLDILIIGNYDKNKIRELSLIYDIEINVKSLSEISFIKSLEKKEILIEEIVKDNIIIHNSEYFIKKFIKFYYKK